jgi:hypothetical protein
MEDLYMSEVFSVLEVLGRGRCVPHARANELQAQPGHSEQQASSNESQAQPGHSEQQASTIESQEQPLLLTVNADDFSALEERILHTVEMVKWERQGRMAAEERALHAEAAQNEHVQRIDALEGKLRALNSDRDSAHLRVERLLKALRDALELPGSAEPGRRPVTSILDRPATGEGAHPKFLAAIG